MDAYTAGIYGARSAALADCLRGYLGMHIEDEPEVVSVRVQCTHQSAGLSVIEWQLTDRNGMAIAGGSL